MFKRGLHKRDKGTDITYRNNPDHVLSPDNYDIVLKARFKKIDPKVFKKYYIELISSRWKNRKEEFKDLLKLGLNGDVTLICYCGKKEKDCHAQYAVDFMNNLIKKIKSKPT